MEFSERLRTARERMGYSQYRLAAVSHVSRRAIIEYEMGRARPRAENMRRLRCVLGAALEESGRRGRSIAAYARSLDRA